MDPPAWAFGVAAAVVDQAVEIVVVAAAVVRAVEIVVVTAAVVGQAAETAAAAVVQTVDIVVASYLPPVAVAVDPVPS